jgi:hypothetical protein
VTVQIGEAEADVAIVPGRALGPSIICRTYDRRAVPTHPSADFFGIQTRRISLAVRAAFGLLGGLSPHVRRGPIRPSLGAIRGHTTIQKSIEQAATQANSLHESLVESIRESLRRALRPPFDAHAATRISGESELRLSTTEPSHSSPRRTAATS